MACHPGSCHRGSRRCWHDSSGRYFDCRYGRRFIQLDDSIDPVGADKVPLRDVATWRGYVNVVSTVGRSAGGPIGGYLADTIGWRW